MVYFPRTLVTDLSGDGLLLRLSLDVPELEFLDFSEFHDIYQDQPQEVRDKYLPNELGLEGHRQGNLAFIVRGDVLVGPLDVFHLSVLDKRGTGTLVVSELGEHTHSEPQPTWRQRVVTKVLDAGVFVQLAVALTAAALIAFAGFMVKYLVALVGG